MLRIDITIFYTEEPGRKRFHVGHEHKANACRIEEFLSCFNECSGLGNMFEDSPESDGIELFVIDNSFEKIPADNRDALRLRVVQRRAANVGAKNFVSSWKLPAQLEEECARGTTYIQHRAR